MKDFIAMIKYYYRLVLKIGLVIFVFLTVLNLFFYFMAKDRPTVAFDPIKQNREQLYQMINDPALKKTDKGKMQIALSKTISCAMIGEACTDNPADGDKNFHQSAFGLMSMLISAPMQNPPASGVMWAYNGLQNAGLVPHAYAAQGIGFAALKPIEDIWKIFRDMAYLVIVVVFMIIGFMIMFRMKLNPQTVISVENALPRIVVSLLLITFSFAIAGFMIDLMYVLMALIISLLGSTPASHIDVGAFQNKYLSAGPDLLINDVLFPYKGAANPIISTINTILTFAFPGMSLPSEALDKLWNLGAIANSILFIFPAGVQLFFYVLGGFVSGFLVNKAVGETSQYTVLLRNLGIATVNVGDLFSGGVNIFVRFVAAIVFGFISLQILLMVIVLFTIIFLFFRLFFMLLNAYLRILFLVIFSPLFMLYEAIPGRKGFAMWFMSLAADVLTFPLTAGMLVTGYVLVNNIGGTWTAWAQPFGVPFGLSNPVWAPPFLIGLNQSAYAFLVGMGTIYIIPQVVKLMRDAMGVKKSPISVGLGTFLGSAGVVASGGATVLGQFSAIAGAFGGPSAAGKILSYFRIPGVERFQNFVQGTTGGTREVDATVPPAAQPPAQPKS